MKLGPVFLILAGLFILLAAELGGLGWLLLWPALSFVAVAAAYMGLGPALLGKRLDGTLAPWALTLWLPYFALTTLSWFLQCVLNPDNAYHEVASGLWLGRWLWREQLPPGIDLVVDLTAEFPELSKVKAGRRYICLPTLDATTPAEEATMALVKTIADWPGKVYLHCALGHGRSAMVAAAVLVARGLVTDGIQAEAAVRKVRPRIWLNREQRRLLAELAAKVRR